MHTRTNRTAAIALVAALQIFFVTSARAESTDCFPLCQQATETSVPASPDAGRDDRVSGCASLLADLEESPLVRKAESINERAKPVKEIAGYIRSPQGLAVKLVNDHVVRIPAWVKYAADPVGSLRNRAMGEVKSQARSMMKRDASCRVEAETDTGDNWDKFSI